MHILDKGDVILEFLKKKDGSDKVLEVIKVSPDGTKVCDLFLLFSIAISERSTKKSNLYFVTRNIVDTCTCT